MSVAVPKPLLAGTSLSMATAAPTTVAATATMIKDSTSSCWRHSRRNRRHAQRLTARRAGAPAIARTGARSAGPYPATEHHDAHGQQDQDDYESRGPDRHRRAGGWARRDSGLGGGTVWSTTRPSRMNTTLSAQEASCASWVTTTADTPRLHAAKIRRMTASPFSESRAPEGSSASRRRRSPTMARAMATR